MPSPVVPLSWKFRPNGANRRVDVELPGKIQYVRIVYAPIDFRLYAGYGTSTPVRYVRSGEAVDIWLPELVSQLSYTWEAADDPGDPDANESIAILICSGGPIESSGTIASPVLLKSYDGTTPDGYVPWGVVDEADDAYTGLGRAGLVYITNGSVPVADAQELTFDVAPQRATRDYSTALVFGAAGRQLLMTIWNTAGNQYYADLVRVDVAMMESSAAAEVWFDLMRITTIPTGGSTYTPVGRSGGASVMAVKRIPSGGGAETGINYSSVVYKTGITGAVSVVNPTPPILWQRLFERSFGSEDALRAVPGAGLAVVVDCNAAATVRCVARMTWQEVPV